MSNFLELLKEKPPLHFDNNLQMTKQVYCKGYLSQNFVLTSEEFEKQFK